MAVGRETLIPLQLRIPLCLLILIALAACRGEPPAARMLPSQAPTQPGMVSPAATPAPVASLPPQETKPNAGFPTAPSPSPMLEKALETPPAFLDNLPTPQKITPANAATLVLVQRLSLGLWDQVLALAWSPDNQTLAASAGEDILLLKVPDLVEQRQIELGVWAPALAYSPDGRSLASGDRDGVLRTWDPASGDLLLEIQAHQKPMSAATYSPDGRTLASGGYDALARIWDSHSGENLSEMIGGTFAIPAIAFTPDGASLAIVNGNIIRLRDVLSTRFMRTIAGEAPFFSIAFSPDGSLMASGDVANTVRLWDMSGEISPSVEVRESLYTLQDHAGRPGSPDALIWKVSFSPDGSLLASAGGDGTIRIWEVASGELLAILEGHSKAVTSAVFSPDGAWLASGGLDGTVLLWSAVP